MRKKEAYAWIITLTLGLTAGCAPGDISRYAARAQQAGEAIFEGAAPVLADAGDAAAETQKSEESSKAGSETVLESENTPESMENTEAEDTAAEDFTDRTETEKTAEDETAALDTETGSEAEITLDTETASEAENASGTEAEDETERETETASGTEAESETETASDTEAENETETASDTEAESETETASATEAESETKPASAAETTRETESQEPSVSEALPAMMAQTEERVQTAMDQKADSFSGKLAGADTLTRAEQEALQAVLQRETYSDKTLCLIDTAAFEEKKTESFLLLCDSTALTARGRVDGDLWFYDGTRATKVVGNAEFLQAERIQCGTGSYLLIQTVKDGKTNAQLYQVKDGKAQACFANAVSIEQEGNGLKVNYKSDHVQYDPVRAEWTGSEAEITYYYVPEEGGFAQESVRKLTLEQYLAYIQPGEDDAEGLRFLEEQEQKLQGYETEDAEYRYSFFAIGENRIGYRECRIGVSSETSDENGSAAAEYRYHIAKLGNGALTAQGETLSGSGYYFENWEQQKEELAELEKIPVLYLKNRIDRAAQVLTARERTGLESVLAVQEYDADGLCFVESADYDGDGKPESFVAVGRYDGIFCAPVCDLWFAAGDEPVLLAENLPLKSVLSYEQGETALLLLEGYMSQGARDRLYGVKENAAQRYLEDAVTIEMGENGDLTVRTAGTENAMPRYYHAAGGEVTEYGIEEAAPEVLLEYDNGKTVYRHAQRLAKLQGGDFSCMKGENGLIHLLFAGQTEESGYETWRVQNGSLVLIDCGEGGYRAQVQESETPAADPDNTERDAPTEPE